MIAVSKYPHNVAHISEGVSEVEKLTFKRCTRFDDACITELAKYVSQSVSHLEIIGCGDVSNSGIEQLYQLKYV